MNGEQCSMRYHVNAVFCPGNGVIHGALGLYSANRHGEQQVGMCLTEHNATIDALLMEIEAQSARAQYALVHGTCSPLLAGYWLAAI